MHQSVVPSRWRIPERSGGKRFVQWFMGRDIMVLEVRDGPLRRSSVIALRGEIIIMENISVAGEVYEIFSPEELASSEEAPAVPNAPKSRLIDGKEYTYSGLGSTKVHFRKMQDDRWEVYGALPASWPQHITSFNAIYQLRMMIDYCHIMEEFPQTDFFAEPTLEKFPSLLDRSTVWGVLDTTR